MAQKASGSRTLPSVLFADATATGNAGEADGDRSFAADLNLDQIVAEIAGDREEGDLITAVLFGHLHDAAAVRYRQEVFRDLEDSTLVRQREQFGDRMLQVRARVGQVKCMGERYQRECWSLGPPATCCDAVRSLAGHLASAQISS